MGRTSLKKHLTGKSVEVFKCPIEIPIKRRGKSRKTSFNDDEKENRATKDNKKDTNSALKSELEIFSLPPLLSPIKELRKIRIKPYAYVEPKQRQRLIDDELRMMIDTFSKNIENLAHESERLKNLKEENSRQIFHVPINVKEPKLKRQRIA